MFEAVEQSTLRLKILDSISSTSPRTHELRRRLAMCFYFNSLFYSINPSHDLMDLERFIKRLRDPVFDTTSKTDYRELAALIAILDIAVDDGRNSRIDLSNMAIERKFNEDIDTLVATIKEIMGSIGNLGAAFISRIEAKESLELVSQRISDTLRSKPKPKQTWLEEALRKPEEDLDAEKLGMQSFVTKMKGFSSVHSGPVAR